MWKSMCKNGQKVLQNPQQKEIQTGVSQGPHSSQDYQERGNEILSKMYEMFCMDHENKENPQMPCLFLCCIPMIVKLLREREYVVCQSK